MHVNHIVISAADWIRMHAGEGYRTVNESFIRAACAEGPNCGHWGDGSTATNVVLHGSTLWVANVGDSHAFLFRGTESARLP